MDDIEKRTISGTIEYRSTTDPEQSSATLVGYAALFNTRSEKMACFGDATIFVEVIAPGAFDDVLNQDVRALFNHDPSYVLGRTTSGTLQLSVDERGLKYEIQVPDNPTIRDLVLEPIKRGDVSQSSFGFSCDASASLWTEEDERTYVRTIHKVKRLYDVSPVTYPAYSSTETALRSLDTFKQQQALPTPCTRSAQHQRELDLLQLYM